MPRRPKTPLTFRDRIVELRRVPARELRPSDRNWRTHPAAQQTALKAILGEIGYADALIAYTADDGRLTLIDGHLRADTTPDQEVPVLVTDLTAAEAHLLLAVLDPLASMAQAHTQQLDALLRQVTTGDAGVQAMLAELASQSGLYAAPSRPKRRRRRHTADETTPGDGLEPLPPADGSEPIDGKLAPEFVVRVLCRDQAHQHEVYETLAAQGYQVRMGGRLVRGEALGPAATSVENDPWPDLPN
jgi:hypothetical protein